MTDKKSPLFEAVRAELDFPKDEAKILAFWKERGIFGKTLDASTRATGPSKGTYVFYEGPPTANGMPHNGHVLTRAVKDVFPRYKTMRGFDVPRKAGWDTHGLPVEVEVEKELHIHGKAAIEAYGVKPFINRCIASVFRYTDAWEKLTDKIGFWVDTQDAYVTYHKSYVESVWWALSQLFKKGLLYKGHRVCWWWPQGGTALSAAEVGWNYKTVDDPSCFVAFPLADDADTALLAWTTTPWTLPSNGYAAVREDFEYAVVAGWSKKLIVAKELVEPLAKKLKVELTIVSTMRGSELVGKKYTPPFATFAEHASFYFRVIAADFVTLDKGSGIVHVAPAFGEDDFAAHKKEIGGRTDVPLLCSVRPDGTFGPEMGELAGVFVKDGDKALMKDLEARGLLVHHELYRHEYPYCWRADEDPLIQLARPGWYIKTTQVIDRALANNEKVNWLPEHVKEGRFGDFLRNNVDWALSRERYWGTPLNVWICSANADHMHAPASAAEIEKLNPHAFDAFRAARAADPTLSEHLIVHKPWIDEVTLPCPHCGAEMKRATEVIDCWFDSGAMPFAQWGYPHVEGSKALFERAFPADVISEAIDQTRGWFYSLLMIATLLFDEESQAELGLKKREFPLPYKTCLVLGHVCDRDGKKESKSKGNYTPPEVILDRVRMEFAVLDLAEQKSKVDKRGVAFIAREDFEGLDFAGESAKVVLYREDSDARVTMELKPGKGLPRRVIAMHPEDIAGLGLQPKDKAIETKPVDVPRLPAEQKVFVEDPATPAPGADAFRWFFYASSPPWSSTRHSLSNVRAEQKELTIKLRNVYSFFVIYANIDGFNPARDKGRPAAERSLLDRWMLSEVALATRDVTNALEGHLLYDAARRLVDLVDALSNWYVRRSRDRFWSSNDAPAAAVADKHDAYATLYEALVTIAKLLAPFTPFFADELYQNLVRKAFPDAAESVHLAAWPDVDEARIDAPLAREMRAVRELVSLGLQVRTANKLKVRQPLARADLVLSTAALAGPLASHVSLIAEELNVKEVCFLKPGEEGSAVRYVLKPNFRALGPKLGKRVQLAKQVLAKADASALRADLALNGKTTIDLEGDAIELGPEEIEVAVEASAGFAAAGGRVGVVVIHTALTDELRDEGLAREILAKVQGARKDSALGFTDRIALWIDGSDRVKRVAEASRALFESDALATALTVGSIGDGIEPRSSSVDGEALVIGLQKRS
jgi:isoleucyl-tRNA synthetase